MMNRFEIHIPLRYNDGTAVEQQKIEQTQAELYERFGGVTVAGPVTGWWVDQDTVYEDDQLLFVVDTEEADPCFWAPYANELKHRFQQEELYVVAYSVHLLDTPVIDDAPVLSGVLHAQPA